MRRPCLKKENSMPRGLIWRIRRSKLGLSRWLAVGMVAVGVTHARAPIDATQWTEGNYKLVDKKSTNGTLVVHRSSRKTVEFSIEVVSCMNYCGSENAVNHVAVIDRGLAETRGVRASYSMPSDETTKCNVELRRESSSAITVIQDNACSDFGQGMSVTGRYRFVKAR